MSLALSFEAAERNYHSYLTSASKAVNNQPSPQSSPYSTVASPNAPLQESNELSHASRQYKALRDLPYTAIRPIAVKVADQPIMAGVRENAPASGGDRFRTKAWTPKQWKAYREKRRMRRLLYANDPAPEFVRKQLLDGLDPDPHHPALDVFEYPNPYMTGWALRYVTAMSIHATGVSYWWILPVQDEYGQDTIQLWYLPTTWVTPIHGEDRPFVAFKVKPPGAEEEKAMTRPAEEFCRFAMPDPANPLGTLSPMQSQARAINTDDEIQKAQFASMRNGLNPGMILVGGNHPNPPGVPGVGPRVEFTPEQRKQLIESLRLAYAGALHYGDPLILDALITDAYPYTRSPAELAFLESSQLTKNRIMQGIGTNPIVAGQIEGANRATAAVAHEGFYSVVVNPTITMMSEVMSLRLAPYFNKGGSQRLYIWIERAEAFDADLKLKQMALLVSAKAIRKNELREYGGLEKIDGPEGDEWAGPDTPPPEPEAAPAGESATEPARAKPAARPAVATRQPPKRSRG